MKTTVLTLPYDLVLAIPDNVDPASLKALLADSVLYSVNKNFTGNRMIYSYKEQETPLTLATIELSLDKKTIEVSEILAENNRLTRELEALKASLEVTSKEIANV